jgi:hypothetical protein
MKKLIIAGVILAAAVAAALVPVGGGAAAEDGVEKGEAMDLSAFSDAKPDKPLKVLFIHHSCGGQMIADPGDEEGPGKGTRLEIWNKHPRGGGARSLLVQNGYVLHEASYDSEIGEKTDLFDWWPKFSQKMDKVKRTKMQDELLPEGEKNDVVVFKSCYPNNEFVGEGDGAGNPEGPELTLANAKATMTKVREELAKHPDTLFIYMTSPPQAQMVAKERAWKWVAKKVLGKPDAAAKHTEAARIARRFSNWIVSKDGWLAGYEGKNIAVFNYYDVLTDGGMSNFSRYPSEDGWDSHPSSAGNQKVAQSLIPFMNRAARRAGLTQ